MPRRAARTATDAVAWGARAESSTVTMPTIGVYILPSARRYRALITAASNEPIYGGYLYGEYFSKLDTRRRGRLPPGAVESDRCIVVCAWWWLLLHWCPPRAAAANGESTSKRQPLKIRYPVAAVLPHIHPFTVRRRLS